MKEIHSSTDMGLIAEALKDSQLSFVVVDIRAADNPIIYANKAFEFLTGFGQQEILGRNCRFLQGDDTDQDGRHIVHRALEKREPCHAVLRNYRKNGTRFLNHLRLSPIRNRHGTVTHYFGCQMELDIHDLIRMRDGALQNAHELTPREHEMLSQIVKGQSTKGAARSLGISPRTAEKHRQSLMRKLGVANAVELVRLTTSPQGKDLAEV